MSDLDGVAEPPLDLGTYTRPSAADCAALDPRAPAAGPGARPVELAGTPPVAVEPPVAVDP